MKVFLSSTYNDLTEHRKAAHEALERLGLHVIRMEAFGARPEESTQACLKEVEECDLFVGIYAHRYGYIPPGSAVSITEQEFDHAQKLGKPIFGFIVHEDHPWPPKFIEYDQKAKREAFLEKVKQRPVEFFTTADNLAQKIASSIGRRLAEIQAPSEETRRNHITVNVDGNFSGNLIVGSQNTIGAPFPISNYHVPIYHPPKPTGSTLPQVGFFVGREKELHIIASALSPETRTWGVLIDGPGGIGKTALAVKAAHDAPAELFERKIFITAKVRELTAEGEKPLTDFTRPTYLAMLDELGRELGIEHLEKLPPEARANELRLALAGKKTLIIFDNLETLPEDERTRLFQFLSRLPEGNKAIVTSRRRPDVEARIVRLDRLARDEALQLIAELAAKYPRLAHASQKEYKDLYDITQGNPLLIHWIAGQLGREGSQCRTIAEACAFLDKAPKGNNPLEYIFGDLLETFTADETQVLAALTHFTQPANLKWIAELTGLPERAAETALEDLSDRSITITHYHSPITTYSLPPLAATFIRTRRPEAVTQTGDILTDRAHTLAVQYGGGSKDYEKFPTLDTEWDLLSAALPRLLTGDNTRLQVICNQLSQFLHFTGRWDDWLWLSEQAEARALAAGDTENAGWRAYQAGWVYSLRNQPVEALACAARAAEYWRDSAPRNKATAGQLRGLGYKLNKEYPAAIAAFREALEIYRSISPESNDVAVVLNDLAGAEHLNKNYPAAERDYREALRIAKLTKNQELIAILTGNLADLALDRKQWAEAEPLARKALALAEKVGRLELIASDCHRIAQALLKQHTALSGGSSSPKDVSRPAVEGLNEALTFSRRAVEIFTRLRHKDLQAAQETLEEVESAVISV